MKGFTNDQKRTMRTISIVAILTAGLLFSTGCKKDTETICKNLLDQGLADTSMLNGEWVLTSFARTINGRKVIVKEKNNGAALEFNAIGDNNVILRVYGGNSMYFTLDIISANYMTLHGGGGTLVNSPPEVAALENRLRESLTNTLCYAIKGNELLIHFEESDKKNILVLKKK